jgi:hypothetical protein
VEVLVDIHYDLKYNLFVIYYVIAY